MSTNGCATGIVSSVEVPIQTDECACIGVKSIVWNSNNTVTITLTDNSSITSPVLLGPQGIQGPAGVPGSNGANGTNGKDVEMRYDVGTKTIQWRLVGSLTWIDLYTFPSDETWKAIKIVSTDTFEDGAAVPSYNSGINPVGDTYIRKKADGDVEIAINISVNVNAQSALLFTIPVTPTGYRPTKAGWFHLTCSNATDIVGSILVNTNGQVTARLNTGQVLAGGFGGTATINAYIRFSTSN